MSAKLKFLAAFASAALLLAIVPIAQNAIAQPVGASVQNDAIEDLNIDQKARKEIANFFENALGTTTIGNIVSKEPFTNSAVGRCLVYECNGYRFRYIEANKSLYSITNLLIGQSKPLFDNVTSESGFVDRANEIISFAFPSLIRTESPEVYIDGSPESGYEIAIREKIGENFYTGNIFVASISQNGEMLNAAAMNKGFSLQNANVGGLSESEAVEAAYGAIQRQASSQHVINTFRKLTENSYEWVVRITIPDENANFVVNVNGIDGKSEIF